MTIGTTSNTIVAQGNGATTAFAYPFLMPAASDAVVTYTSPTGVQTVVPANQYTITGIGLATGGTVTYLLSGSPIPSGSTLTIQRILPLVQTTSVSNQGQSFAAIENELDYEMMCIQQDANNVSRAIVINPADVNLPTPLPVASVRAGNYLVFDSHGNPTVSSTISGGVTVSGPMIPVVGAASTMLALELLGVSTAMYPVVSAATTSGALQQLGAIVSLLNIAALRAYTGLTSVPIYVEGYYAANDGGQGFFLSGASSTDDGGSVIHDGNGNSWHRQFASFGFSVRAWGAKGDGATNDYTAIQTTITYCATNGVGPVFVPAGNYVVDTVLTVNTNGLNIVGVSNNESFIQTGSGNQQLIDITGSRNQLRNLLLANNGVNTVPAVTVYLNAAVETIVTDCLILGGYYPVAVNNGADNVFTRCKILNSYGPAQVYLTSSGTYFERCKIDQGWPMGNPINANFRGAWAASTVYGGFDVVSYGGYYFQCVGGGTSGTLGLSLSAYGVNQVDGTVSWQTACSTGLVAVQVDTNSFANYFLHCDCAGAYRGGYYITNTLSGTAPQAVTITDSNIDSYVEFGIRAIAGAGVIIKGLTIESPVHSGAVGVQAGSSLGGDFTITNSKIIGVPTGIDVGGGTNTVISNNQVYGSTTCAINIEPNVNQFTITGNQVGQSNTWGTNAIGIRVQSGTSNFYVIVGNNTAGASTGITDGGSGGSKAVASNI